jgi:hypothetical protein
MPVLAESAHLLIIYGFLPFALSGRGREGKKFKTWLPCCPTKKETANQKNVFNHRLHGGVKRIRPMKKFSLSRITWAIPDLRVGFRRKTGVGAKRA